jgi:hypothetical protein
MIDPAPTTSEKQTDNPEEIDERLLII